MSAAMRLQEAAIAALETAPGIGGIYDGQPVQAAFPYAVVECGPESDWSNKSGAGREVRLAVSVRDEGERPARVQRLMAEAEAALSLTAVEGWQLVNLGFIRSHLVRETGGAGRPGLPRWAGVIEYRARMLAAAPSP